MSHVLAKMSDVSDPDDPLPGCSRDTSNLTVSEMDVIDEHENSSEDYESDEEYNPIEDGSDSSIGESLIDELNDDF